MSTEMRQMTREEKRIFWKDQVERFSCSGQEVKEYCRENGLSFHSFRSWRTRIKKEIGLNGESFNRSSREKSSTLVPSARLTAFTRAVIKTPKAELNIAGENSRLGKWGPQSRTKPIPNAKWLAEFVIAILAEALEKSEK